MTHSKLVTASVYNAIEFGVTPTYSRAISDFQFELNSKLKLTYNLSHSRV